jgi:murein DD-endopeptidase MepM/ murein hydrolase activator NlpD
MLSRMIWSIAVLAIAAVGTPGLSDHEILDPYRPPQCTWCPGNRGIEFDTPSGYEVRALRSGYVSYVGFVAGIGFVVVDIGEGLRVTYGGVVPADVRVGDPVPAGSVLGIAEGSLHLGVRRQDSYIDPSILWAPRTVRARLIPG